MQCRLMPGVCAAHCLTRYDKSAMTSQILQFSKQNFANAHTVQQILCSADVSVETAAKQ